MFCHARREHIRDQPRHGGGTKHIIKAMKPFAKQERIHVEKEVVNVLHSDLKIFEPQLEGEDRS
jgi:hypothetical protein